MTARTGIPLLLTTSAPMPLDMALAPPSHLNEDGVMVFDAVVPIADELPTFSPGDLRAIPDITNRSDFMRKLGITPGLDSQFPPIPVLEGFNPNRITVNSETGEIHYTHLNGQQTNLSFFISNFRALSDFLSCFCDASVLEEALAHAEKISSSFTANIPGFQSYEEGGATVITVDLATIVSAAFFGGGLSIKNNPPQIFDRIVEIAPGVRMGIISSMDVLGNLIFHVTLEGFLPDGEVIKINYDSNGTAVYDKGHMAHFSPLSFPNVVRPTNLTVAKDGTYASGDLRFAVKTLRTAQQADLARSLSERGDPCNRHDSPPHLHNDEKMGMYEDKEAASRFQERGTEERNERRRSAAQSAQQLMHKMQLDPGNTEHLLEIHSHNTNVKDIFAFTSDSRFMLPSGKTLLVWHYPKRLDVVAAGHKPDEKLPSPSSISRLSHDIAILNELVDTRKVCYTLNQAYGGRQVIHVFVYDDADQEWQYFTRLDYTDLGMAQITPSEVKHSAILSAAGHELTVNLSELEENSGISTSDLTNDEKAMLRGARLYRSDRTVGSDDIQNTYSFTLADFLAKLMRDLKGFYFGMNFADIFNGTTDPLLQYLIFTYSEDIHELIQEYMTVKNPKSDTLYNLARRFDFALIPEMADFLKMDDRMRDWQRSEALKEARARAFLTQKSISSAEGVFSVVLDLDPGRSGRSAPLPPKSSGKSASCSQPSKKGPGIWDGPGIMA